MRIFTGTMMEEVAWRIQEHTRYLYDARGMSCTVTFEDDEGAAYITFCQGQIFTTGDGYSPFGSDFYIAADNETWDTCFCGDPRSRIYELSGGPIKLKGNMFAFAANAKAFTNLWEIVRDIYLEGKENENCG